MKLIVFFALFDFICLLQESVASPILIPALLVKKGFIVKKLIVKKAIHTKAAGARLVTHSLLHG